MHIVARRNAFAAIFGQAYPLAPCKIRSILFASANAHS
jgi:hypothetical protein